MRALVSLVGVWVIIGCNGAQHEDAPPASTAVMAATPSIPTIDVITAVSKPLDVTTHLEGELSPYEAVSLFAKVNGFVSSVAVDRGSRVKKGQVLVTLVAPEIHAQRAEAAAKLAGDSSTYERLKGASATSGAISGQELELADAAAKADRARLQAIQALEQYLVVTAPFDGMVTERDVHPGALVGPQGAGSSIPMLRIEEVAKLRLTVAVPENLLGAMVEGTKTNFTTRAFADSKFIGIVSRIAHSVDVKTRTMPVELDVDNRDGRLAPGMFADVVWHVKRSSPSILVPPSSIVQSTEKTFVIRIKDGIVEQVPVQRGIVQPNQVEVWGELQPGDMLARLGTEELKNGARVNVHVQKVESAVRGDAGALPDGGRR